MGFFGGPDKLEIQFNIFCSSPLFTHSFPIALKGMTWHALSSLTFMLNPKISVSAHRCLLRFFSPIHLTVYPHIPYVIIYFPLMHSIYEWIFWRLIIQRFHIGCAVLTNYIRIIWIHSGEKRIERPLGSPLVPLPFSCCCAWTMWGMDVRLWLQFCSTVMLPLFQQLFIPSKSSFAIVGE